MTADICTCTCLCVSVVTGTDITHSTHVHCNAITRCPSHSAVVSSLTACFLEKSSRSMTPQYLSASVSGSFFILPPPPCCIGSSSRSFLGRFTVRLTRRAATDAGVVTATDDVAGVTGELTVVVVSAFLLTPFLFYIDSLTSQHCQVTTASCTQHSVSPTHHNRFTALFPGPPRAASARRKLLDFMVQGKINRGRNTNHPAGRHSIRTNQCPPPPSPPPFFYRPDALPASQPTVSKQ